MRRLILLLQYYCFVVCASEKPNIILILGDDMGWNDVGFHGSNQIPTPNIDALGYNGVILNRFYTQATCTPSRAALLTGNYPMRIGFQGEPMSAGEKRYIPLDMPTLPEKLKSLGYSTHLVGKWHLGYACRGYTPTGRGFDEHFGYWNGYVGYFNYSIGNNVMDGYDLHSNLDPAWSENGQYATDVFTEKTIETILNHNKTNPLFLMVTHLAPHTGFDSTLEVPDLDHTNQKFGYIEDEKRRIYADIVNRLDESVGKIVKTLSDENMLENSIVIFISDNGGPTVGVFENRASNWPLKGIKSTLFEGGVRVAAAIYSPLLLNKGYVNNEMIHITDLFATILSVAGGNVENLSNIDSVDQWSTISENATSQRQELLLDYDEVGNKMAIIGSEGRFKLINGTHANGVYDAHFGETGRDNGSPNYNISEILSSHVNTAILSSSDENRLTEEVIQVLRLQANMTCNKPEEDDLICTDGCLFDLLEDPCENTNVIAEFPDVALQLIAQLEVFKSELVPQGDRATDPRSNPIYFDGVWSTWLENIECPII